MDPLEPLRRVARDLLDPQRIAGAIEALIWLALIALAAMVALRVSLGLVRRTEALRGAHPAGRMTPIAEGLLRYTIIFTALILMLGTVHINITPILASATVVGLSIGFGAQYLIRDVLAGFFLLLEGTIQAGDVVRVDSPIRVDGDLGTVERLTLRTTRIRKFSGELLTVPNGSITRIANLSRDYARAIVQVLIPYSANVGAALEALHDAGRAWADAHAADRQAEPKADGIVDLRDAGAVLQCSVLVLPGTQDAVASELRRHILEAMARRGLTPGVGPVAPPRSS